MKLVLLIAAALLAPKPAAVDCTKVLRHGQCWEAEKRCESTPARNWKPCRKDVARCFREADRCYGSWTL
jgi:hypothetical protein